MADTYLFIKLYSIFYKFILPESKHSPNSLEKIKKILVCPLEWGLGHATRCVPIISKLLEYNIEVLVAADNQPLALLKRQFPQLQFIKFSGFNIKYPNKGNMLLKMLVSLPSIIKGIHKEHQQLKKIIEEYQIDAVISDNRFGLWNKNIRTIYMTHQIMIKVPGLFSVLEPVLYLVHKYFISKYDTCWIPDFPGSNNLSGDLAHKYKLPKNAIFIGPLTRLDNYPASGTPDKDTETPEIMAIISGPEPQRSLFENIILNQLKTSDYSAVVVLGIAKKDVHYTINNKINVYSHLDTKAFLNYLISARIVICRSGYSSIMDLVSLGKKAILIPTPGQTEQEYLASYYQRKKIFYTEKQSKFNLYEAMKQSKSFHGITIQPQPQLLDEAIKKLIGEN